jgi:NADH/F420H2 dehydrogenase subunit C
MDDYETDVSPEECGYPEILDLIRSTVDEDRRCEPSEYRGELRIIIEPEDLLPVARALKETEPFYFLHLSDITSVDYPDREEGRFDVVYQFYSFKINERVRLRLIVGEDESVPSLTPLWDTADWLERECYDMFGVEFDGHPKLEHILMPKATRSHPLRKDYPLEPRKNYQERRPEVEQEAEEWEIDSEHHPR